MKMGLSVKFSTILTKKYISHVHTTYTDGENSIEEYCAWAYNNAFDVLVFSDHVRKELSYDFNEYVRDIKKAGQLFPSLELWAGAEAKVTEDGSLDIPEDVISKTDVLFFACHSFPNDPVLYKSAFSKAFQDKKWKNHVRVWAHPGLFFKTWNLVDSGNILGDLINLAKSEGIFIEKNLRYNLPHDKMFSTLDPSQKIIGYDAHSLESLHSQ